MTMTKGGIRSARFVAAGTTLRIVLTPVVMALVSAVALAGFSQGAMMVLHAGLRRRPPPRGILAYSGALLDSPALARECSGHPPVLLVHGEADEVVPFDRAGAASAALARLGMPVQTLWCPGLGHGIDEAGLSTGALFLQRVFA